MSPGEICILVLLVAVAIITAAHYHAAIAARAETAIANLSHQLARQTAAPQPVLHLVSVPVAPATPITSPVLLAPTSLTPTPTPQAPSDWPAGSGEVSGTLVRNDQLPGYPAGGPMWSFAQAQIEYARFAPYMIAALQADPRFAGKVWRTDGPNGPGPYVA